MVRSILHPVVDQAYKSNGMALSKEIRLTEKPRFRLFWVPVASQWVCFRQIAFVIDGDERIFKYWQNWGNCK